MRNILKTGLLIVISTAMLTCRANTYKQGQSLYEVHCESCHMEDGSGLAKLIPSLHSSLLWKKSPEGLICLIRHGIKTNPDTGQEMPGNMILNEVELTNLSNYLRSLYLENPETINVLDVRQWMERCE